MQAIILAAGMGKRLKDLTKNNPKCMVKVNGVTLIDRMLHQLDRLQLDRIIIVVGYKADELIDYISTLNISTPIIYERNPIYDRTNNIYSLSLAKDYLTSADTLILENDLIFEDSVLEDIYYDPRPTLALVDKYQSWMDGTCVKINKNDEIYRFVPGKDFRYSDIKDYYKTVNIYKFSRDFSEKYYVPFLLAYSEALGHNEYYEQVLRVITLLDDSQIKAKRLNHQLWYEIDDLQDLDIATSIFTNDKSKRLDRLQSRFGGYWRYPNMLDFCYLVNPYFPPQRLVDEIQASFTTLLTEYPSGSRVNNLLAAKTWGVPEEYITVGNGAAELIRTLLGCLSGRLGIIRPTFEEYPHSYSSDQTIVFVPNTNKYTYSASELIEFFGQHDISTLVLINPDNPSGNYLPHDELLELLDWCKSRDTKLILDESFVDFADEPDSSLIKTNILHQYPNLIVIKSISKSHGVPGLRLGLLATSDSELMQQIRASLPIWNINSFAEFYLQILEKYRKDFELALDKFRAERGTFAAELVKIPDLNVFPSQANYFIIQLRNITASELAERLLVDYDIFIKDLSSKLNRNDLCRIAIRNHTDNSRLIAALREILEQS